MSFDPISSCISKSVQVLQTVIWMADAAAAAEIPRQHRRDSFNLARMPSFGADMSDYLPSDESHALAAYIAAQDRAIRALLVAVMYLGRSREDLSETKYEDCLELGHANAEHAASILVAKGSLAEYLRGGLQRLFFGSLSRRSGSGPGASQAVVTAVQGERPYSSSPR